MTQKRIQKQYWLFKSEPSTYSIDDLKKEKETEWWGIRNYQVRNMLRDQVRKGDEVLFYHSSAAPIGIAGTGIVTKAGYPDTEQFQKESHYYDSKSTQKEPRWYACSLRFQEKFPRLIPLDELRKREALKHMVILQPGSRLSITPVTEGEFKYIRSLARKPKK